MQQKRNIERKAGIGAADKTLQFAQDLTEELIKDLGGVEGPKLTTIPEGDEDSDEEKSTDSGKRELDNICREPHESTHLVAAYQLVRSRKYCRGGGGLNTILPLIIKFL